VNKRKIPVKEVLKAHYGTQYFLCCHFYPPEMAELIENGIADGGI